MDNQEEEENSVSASQPEAWSPERALRRAPRNAEPDLGGVVSRCPGAGPALTTPPLVRGLRRRTHTSLRSCGLHQPSGGDPGELPHLAGREARRPGALGGTSAPALGTAHTSAIPLSLPLLVCRFLLYLSIPFALPLPCILPTMEWVCSVQAGPASLSNSGRFSRSTLPQSVPSLAPSPGAVPPEPARPTLASCSSGADDGRAGPAGQWAVQARR